MGHGQMILALPVHAKKMGYQAIAA